MPIAGAGRLRDFRPRLAANIFSYNMIRKSGHRFSEKIMLKQKHRAG